jgi:hypothetical protein
MQDLGLVVGGIRTSRRSARRLPASQGSLHSIGKPAERTGARRRPRLRAMQNVSPVTFRGDVPPLGQQPPLGADRPPAGLAYCLDRVVRRPGQVGGLAVADPAGRAWLGHDLVIAKADAEHDHPIDRRPAACSSGRNSRPIQLVNLAVIMGGLGGLSVLAGLYIWLRTWLPRTVLSRRDIARMLNQLACGVTATGARGLSVEVTSDRLLAARERWALAGRAVGWLRAWRAPERQR